MSSIIEEQTTNEMEVTIDGSSSSLVPERSHQAGPASAKVVANLEMTREASQDNPSVEGSPTLAGSMTPLRDEHVAAINSNGSCRHRVRIE